MPCPLCKTKDINFWPNPPRNIDAYECKGCGRFSITAQARNAIGDNGWKLAVYVVEQNKLGIDPIFYSSENGLTKTHQATQTSLQSEAPVGSIGIDTVIDLFPKTVAERFDRILMNLAAATSHLGQPIEVGNGLVSPLLLTKNTDEAFFVIRQLHFEGYITGNVNQLPTSIQLTAKGLNRAADLQRGLFGPLNKQVFVAMSFDDSLTGAWEHGLKLGIEDGGYNALRVDRKHHNEKICDVIVAEIKKSKFLVADFTLHRNGVYFEAGLMMGLGRPVIFTCKKEDIEKAHFDTRQYNHIVWTTPEDLRQQLKSRIQATIVP